MLFTNNNRSETNNSSSTAQLSNKRKIIGGSTSGGASEIPENLLEANCSQEDSFYIQVTSSISELCANCSVKFPISESGHAQTVKEFMSLDKNTGEFTKVSVWKALSVIYQLRIRMYNNIEIATAFCLGEDGNRDLSVCTKCAMSLCRLYKSYMEFQDFSSQNSYISKLIKDKENNRPYSPPVSPISSVSSPPPIMTLPPVVLPLPPRMTCTKTVIRRPTLIVSTGNCSQRPLNLITNKNKAKNSNKMDWSPMSPSASPPPISQQSTMKPPESIGFPTPVYKCGICTENFHSLDELERHRALSTKCQVHQQSHKTYICHLCSRDFNDIMTLNQHMKIHWEPTRVYHHHPCVCHHGSRKCPICGKR